MKIKMLFNGFRHGHVFGLYSKALRNELIEVVGCIEDDTETRVSLEHSRGIVFSDKSYEEWLSGDVDVVAIGNAYGDRGRNVIAALRAGKHVITDKPVCTDPRELSEIARLSAERSLAVICMLDLRYLPQTLAAKRILDSGELGEIRNLSFSGQHYLDYAHRPRWYYEEGMHGGTINDIAIHGIDLVRYLSGREIVAVDAARVWNSYATEQRAFKDSAVFMARLDGGASLLADVSYSAPSQAFSMPTYWEFRFWCEKGMLTFSYVGDTVTIYKDGEVAPSTVKCEHDCGDWLCDLIKSIDTGDLSLTKDTLISSETALKIQAIADADNEQ